MTIIKAKCQSPWDTRSTPSPPMATSSASESSEGQGGYDTAQNVLFTHVVMDLVQPLGRSINRTLYFDNLYTSPDPVR